LNDSPDRLFPLEALWSAPRSTLLVATAILSVAVTYLDWAILDVSLGVIYILPMLPAALALNRWQILAFGSALAIVRSVLIETANPVELFLRFLLSLFAYWAAGLFVVELARNRRLILKHTSEMEEEQKLRREAESHLRVLAESSPAAILTVDEQARVISANQAACEMLGAEAGGQLIGMPIDRCLPVLADALKFSPDSPTFRTAAQCQGRKLTGEVFVAQTWFSTYDVAAGRRLAAIAVDISEEMREREGQNLRHMLANNRIVAAAVSHEMRNVCGATQIVYSKLKALPDLESNDEFRALGGLVDALSKLASAELQTRSRVSLSQLDLVELLTQFRVIIEPDWQEAGGSIAWSVPPSLPPVLGQPYGVLQALMNLAQNSLRAVQKSVRKNLEISAAVDTDRLWLTVADSGPGISEAAHLFEPFKSATGQTGLGLYVSRAILRSYGGNLRHEPAETGCRFVIELALTNRKDMSISE